MSQWLEYLDWNPDPTTYSYVNLGTLRNFSDPCFLSCGRETTLTYLQRFLRSDEKGTLGGKGSVHEWISEIWNPKYFALILHVCEYMHFSQDESKCEETLAPEP